MLTQLCQELKNWFTKERFFGDFVIRNGSLVTDKLQEGQYFRIIGSLYNDGVHLYDDDCLTDEEFHGSVWSLAIPPAVISLAADISQWQEKYGGVDSAAMSPYQSESFGGYSYSKTSGGAGAGNAGTWQSVYASRLNAWRKI